MIYHFKQGVTGMRDDLMLTMKEVQALFKVTRQTVHNWKKRGLPYVRVTPRTIRYPRHELMAWAHRNGKEKYVKAEHV